MIELDDTFIGGKNSGKKGHGAEGKKPILVAVEHGVTHKYLQEYLNELRCRFNRRL